MRHHNHMEQKNKRALLIIDVQNGFVTEHSQHVVPAVEALCQRADYQFVAASQHINHPKSALWNWLSWQKCRREDKHDIALAFTPLEHVYVYEKDTYSALTPKLCDEFKKRGITHVDICGIDTEACVLATALALFDQGMFKPSILPHACGSHACPQTHTQAVQIIETLVGKKAS